MKTAFNNSIITTFSSLSSLSGFIWGFPVLMLILVTSLVLSVKLRFAQLRLLRLAADIRRWCKRAGPGGTSAFSTALGATVGTGSVTGVAVALYTGGAGCIFWMWVSALLGMCLSYCENYLAAVFSADKQLSQKGSGALCYLYHLAAPLAVSYSLFCVLSSLGMGNMAQVSCAVTAASEGFGIDRDLCSFAVVVFCAFAAADKKRCAKICGFLVPIASVIFIGASLLVILSHPLKTASAIGEIFKCAFSFRSWAGGSFSAFFMSVCIGGLRHGAFSHEAGLGTTCAVHCGCGINDAQQQGKLAMAEVFIDTMVICTLTALVILTSGTDYSSSPDGTVTVANAFSSFFGNKAAGRSFTCLCLVLFSLCTLSGWFFIGESAFCSLFRKGSTPYAVIYVLSAFVGTRFTLRTVWDLSDIFNALMAIPNLTGVLVLSKHILPPKFRRLRGV